MDSLTPSGRCREPAGAGRGPADPSPPCPRSPSLTRPRAGKPTLNVTARPRRYRRTYQEILTINATSGVPVSFAGGTPGQTPSVTVTYEISRVTMSDMAEATLHKGLRPCL